MARDWFESVDDADLPVHEFLSDDAAAHLAAGIRIGGVRVLDYGQGDCSAIVDEHGHPIVFFDMGGGKQTGSQTHPWHIEWAADARFATAPWRHKVPDVQQKPTVILSHWDGDHYSTAYYLTNGGRKTKTIPPEAPRVTDLKWLVPRQCRHPSKLAFVLQLSDVACWPTGTKQHRFQLSERTYLQVERCTGSGTHDYDPNLDGLALIVERVDDQEEVVERMLLPGDAPYAYIPSCRNGSLDKVVGLLAFHHGSETHLRRTRSAIPAAAGAAKIVYTFGLKASGERCFGHPSAKAIAAYDSRGWTTPQQPGGSFRKWPPKATDRGDPASRNDVSLTFSAADASQPSPAYAAKSATHTIRSRPKVALRRR